MNDRQWYWIDKSSGKFSRNATSEESDYAEKSLNEQLELKFLKNTASYILQKILRLGEVDRNRESIGLLFYITKMLLILTAGMLFIGAGFGWKLMGVFGKV